MIIDFSNSEEIENESVHNTAEEWEEGEWGYFEEFCLEAKVRGSSVKIRVEMVLTKEKEREKWKCLAF